MIFYLVSVNVVMILTNLLNKHRLVTPRPEIHPPPVLRARIRLYASRLPHPIRAISPPVPRAQIRPAVNPAALPAERRADAPPSAPSTARLACPAAR